MRENPKRPIVFIPGLMGSMGREMIPGTGDWSFGVARWIYNPLIRGLEKNGYVLGENLFICYYDWRRESDEIVHKYLTPMLKQIKSKHSGEPIDMICHSMGGIVARSYIQSPTYDGDIGNLIMIGTPNAGSIDAYHLWSTGTLISDPKKKNSFYSMIQKGYMWVLRKLLNIPWGIENIDGLHRAFPAMGELIPASDYGDILFYKNELGDLKPVFRQWIRYHNFKLDEMNRAIALRHLRNRIEGMYCIIGTDIMTKHCLLIDGDQFIYGNQEVIIGHIDSKEGDGTVMATSAGLPYANCYEMKKSHHKMVEGSLEILQEIYGLNQVESTQEAIEEETLHFIFHCQHAMAINKDGKVLLEYRDKKVKTNYEYIVEEFSEQLTWVVLKNISKGVYIGEMITRDTDLEKLDFIVIGNGVEEELNRREVLRKDRASIQITFTFEVKE